MDQLVIGMDLDSYAASVAKSEKLAQDEDIAEAESVHLNRAKLGQLIMYSRRNKREWFDISNSYNPAIHRIKEAILHASTTSDVRKDPLGDPHRLLVQYFNSPDEIIDSTKDVVQQLKDSLKIKKVPAKIRRRRDQVTNTEGQAE
jgi:ATP-dependent DNA helicase 2 subunit 2